jgi:hypothetical protein
VGKQSSAGWLLLCEEGWKGSSRVLVKGEGREERAGVMGKALNSFLWFGSWIKTGRNQEGVRVSLEAALSSFKNEAKLIVS